MITVIGGVKASVTIKMGPPSSPEGMDPVLEHDPAQKRHQDDISVAYGGCGFSVARRLAAMGHQVAFLSAVGNDPLGQAATEVLREAGVEITGLKRVEGMTPVEVEMLNILGDREMYQNNDALLDAITPEWIREKEHLLSDAEIVFLDGMIPKETLDAVVQAYGNDKEKGPKLFFDPASVEGGEKPKEGISGFYGIVPGRMEAEAMAAGSSIMSEEQLKEAGAFFAKKGISKIIITIKGGGLYYKDHQSEGILRPKRVLSFANTHGAGDVVSAAIVAGEAGGVSLEETARNAMDQAAAFLAELVDERAY